MKQIVPILIGAVIGALFIATLGFLYNKSQKPPVVFKTTTPETTDIVKKTVATGAIVPRQEIEIKPRISGILDELKVEPGQLVKKGDVIATIKIVPNMVNLNAAEASLKAARINFQNAKKELSRYEGLFEQKVISEAEYTRIKLDYELRQQDVSAAGSNLQLIKSGASRKSGKVSNVAESTVDGMVIEVPVKEGTSVTLANNFNAGTTIASIADMGDMIFLGRVDESEVGKIKEGMRLDIQIGALEEHKFTGTLEYISPKGVQVDGAIQFEIKARIDLKPGTFIRAGYSANADIVLDRADKVLAVNESVLQFDDDKKPFVEVELDEQRFERRYVEVGLSDGINIEVKDGLDSGARLKIPRPEG